MASYGREMTGYEVPDLDATLAKAEAAGATVPVVPYASGSRKAAFVQFPRGLHRRDSCASAPMIALAAARRARNCRYPASCPWSACTAALLGFMSACLLGATAVAQQRPAAPFPSRPRILFNRWQEDWSLLADPALRTEPLDGLGYATSTNTISESSKATISMRSTSAIAAPSRSPMRTPLTSTAPYAGTR